MNLGKPLLTQSGRFIRIKPTNWSASWWWLGGGASQNMIYHKMLSQKETSLPTIQCQAMLVYRSVHGLRNVTDIICFDVYYICSAFNCEKQRCWNPNKKNNTGDTTSKKTCGPLWIIPVHGKVEQSWKSLASSPTTDQAPDMRLMAQKSQGQPTGMVLEPCKIC